ncbi:hypothetical protein SO802_013033 [Lithocarpus litseifolius]|uniref:Gag-pol polyprotein n=1 Tax=Lithocarpus litseifolius TaxID=425828 RepID=A0AAW2D526_9ROSI
MSATSSDSESSSSKSDDDVEEDENYTAFMAISSVNATSDLVETNEKDGDDLETNPTVFEVVLGTNFSHSQFSNNEGGGKYARIVENAIRRMKKVEEENEATLEELEIYMCKVKKLKVELDSAYLEIKFLELELIEANSRVDKLSCEKPDSMLEAQRSSSLKLGFGYTREN